MSTERPTMASAASHWFTLLALVGSAIGYQVYVGDYAAAAVLGAIALAAISGHRAGATGMLGLVLGVGAAIQFAQPAARLIEPKLDAWIHHEGLVGRWCGIGIAGAGIAIGIFLITKIISLILSAQWPTARLWDRRIGFLLGAAQGIAAALVFVSGLYLIEPIVQRQLEVAPSNMASLPSRSVADLVIKTNSWTRRSVVGKIATQHDPFELVPALQSVKRGLTVANDPAALQQLEKHPALAAFRDREDVKEAARGLQADPQFQSIMGSRTSLDPSSLSRLLENPAVLEFCDRTKLFDELRRVLPNLQ